MLKRTNLKPPGNLWKRFAGTMNENDNSYAQDGSVQIGPTLEKARLELGLTHEDVERVTKIRSRYLEAMERDDYDTLPGSVYAQGFLKTYANYLDLDGEKLAQELKYQQSAGSAGSITAEPNERPARTDYRNDGSGAAGRFRRMRRKRLSPITVIGLVLGLLLLAIVVAGLYFVGLQASRSSEDAGGSPQAAEGGASPEQNNAPQNPGDGTPEEGANNDAGSRETAQNEPPPEAERQDASGAQEEAVPEPPPPPEPPAPSPPEGLTMEVRVDGNISWLNIEIDGEVVFVEVAEPGFVQTFEAEESITVWSGNAGAVFLSLNGQDYGQFGESGQTKIQEFTLKNAEN